MPKKENEASAKREYGFQTDFRNIGGKKNVYQRFQTGKQHKRHAAC